MKTTKLCLLAVSTLLVLSGCLTSPEQFYQEDDIVVDDRIVGTYNDETDHSQPPTRYSITKDPDYYHKGSYYITVADKPSCSIKFGAVLFQIGTNRFLDMVPIVEACDRIAANPPALIELLQSVTLQPMHLAVGLEVATNGMKFSFGDEPSLLKAAKKFPEYFQQRKPGQFPRLVGDTAREREYLLRFGNDTNIFRTAEIKRESK
jgi:hypothetical protein